MQHSCFCRCFARLQRETSRNFLVKGLWRKCRTNSCSLFFSLPLISPRWPLAFPIFSPHATKFSRSFSKKCLPCFFSLLLALHRCFFSLIFAGLLPTFSFSLPFPFSISKFVDITINISLILETTRIQKQFPLSVFVFIDSLVVSPSQDAGGYAISRQINLELHLGCHTC